MEPVGINDAPGEITGVTCPDCHGSIWTQKGTGGQIKFAYRIGHSYSPESFVESQATNVENALWAGVRALEEQASVSEVLAARAMRVNDRAAADRFEGRRRVATSNAEALRAMLVGERA